MSVANEKLDAVMIMMIYGDILGFVLIWKSISVITTYLVDR